MGKMGALKLTDRVGAGQVFRKGCEVPDGGDPGAEAAKGLVEGVNSVSRLGLLSRRFSV